MPLTCAVGLAGLVAAWTWCPAPVLDAPPPPALPGRRWEATHAIPDDKSSYSTFSLLRERNDATLRALLERDEPAAAAPGSSGPKEGLDALRSPEAAGLGHRAKAMYQARGWS